MRPRNTELFTREIKKDPSNDWLSKIQKMCPHHKFRRSEKATQQQSPIKDIDKPLEVVECKSCGYWFYPDEL